MHFVFSCVNNYCLPLEETQEPQRTVQNSESKIVELEAQVHSLEMASLDKDTHIEKYQAMIGHQEGEYGLLSWQKS